MSPLTSGSASKADLILAVMTLSSTAAPTEPELDPEAPDVSDLAVSDLAVSDLALSERACHGFRVGSTI